MHAEAFISNISLRVFSMLRFFFVRRHQPRFAAFSFLISLAGFFEITLIYRHIDWLSAIAAMRQEVCANARSAHAPSSPPLHTPCHHCTRPRRLCRCLWMLRREPAVASHHQFAESRFLSLLYAPAHRLILAIRRPSSRLQSQAALRSQPQASRVLFPSAASQDRENTIDH